MRNCNISEVMKVCAKIWLVFFRLRYFHRMALLWVLFTITLSLIFKEKNIFICIWNKNYALIMDVQTDLPQIARPPPTKLLLFICSYRPHLSLCLCERISVCVGDYFLFYYLLFYDRIYLPSSRATTSERLAGSRV